MRALDKRQKNYFKDPKRFADAWNGILFRGLEVIDWRDLAECDCVLTNAWGEGSERIADVIMKKTADGKRLALLILENQKEKDYSLPARIFLEEALGYDRQVTEMRRRNEELWKATKNYGTIGEFLYHFRKSDRLSPIVTMVLYWNDEEWDGANSLEELIDFSGAEELRKFVPHYPIRVVDMSKMENAECFQTDLRSVVEYFRRRNDKNAFREYSERCEEKCELDAEGIRVVGELVGSRELVRFLENKTNKRRQDGMCRAITELIEDGRAEGQEQAKLADLRNLMETMQWTAEQAMMALKIPEDARGRIKELL